MGRFQRGLLSLMLDGGRIRLLQNKKSMDRKVSGINKHGRNVVSIPNISLNSMVRRDILFPKKIDSDQHEGFDVYDFFIKSDAINYVKELLDSPINRDYVNSGKWVLKNPNEPESKKPKYVKICHACGNEYVALSASRKYCKERDCEKKRNEEKKAAQAIKPVTKASLIRHRFKSIKAGAEKRGLSFNLSFAFVEKHYQSPCHYCGKKIKSVGFDRVDNKIGYEQNNVVPCCWDCNSMKGTKTYNHFVEQVKLIYHNIASSEKL